MNEGEVERASTSYNASLNEMSNDSTETLAVLDDFLVSSIDTLTGQAWDSVRNNLKTYSDCLKYAEQLGNILQEANDEYMQRIKDFLYPDTDLNTADLPKFESEKASLEKQIFNLLEENKKLAEVPATIDVPDGFDKFGHPITKTVHNPEYDKAQEQIAQNNLLITETLQPRLDEVNRLIEKINTFLNVVLPALNKKLDEVEQKVQEFLDRVNEIVNTLNEGNKALRIVDSSNYDMSTSKGRMLYIYDVLTVKYGYTKDAAKAIITYWYCPNKILEPNLYQSGTKPGRYKNGLGPGYGLCQWEWKMGGIGNGRADKMAAWCKKNGLDYRTIDGQIAWMDHEMSTIDKQCKSLNRDMKNPDYTSRNKGYSTYEDLLGRFGIYYEGGHWDRSINLSKIPSNVKRMATIDKHIEEFQGMPKITIAPTVRYNVNPESDKGKVTDTGNDSLPPSNRRTYGYPDYGGGTYDYSPRSTPTQSTPTQSTKSVIPKEETSIKTPKEVYIEPTSSKPLEERYIEPQHTIEASKPSDNVVVTSPNQSNTQVADNIIHQGFENPSRGVNSPRTNNTYMGEVDAGIPYNPGETSNVNYQPDNYYETPINEHIIIDTPNNGNMISNVANTTKPRLSQYAVAPGVVVAAGGLVGTTLYSSKKKKKKKNHNNNNNNNNNKTKL